MQVSIANDTKLYNLSYGKSVPEWLSSRQRRELSKKNLDYRRRIQLIQNFEMPDVANCMSISKDRRYIFAAGTYKPFLKCYDVEQMSEKFARGIDEEIIKILNLTDDFQKFVLLEQQRWVEMHYPRGRYFRLRIPKYGRDMGFINERSELVISASGDEVYRLNLEQGEFLEPYRLQGGSGTALAVAEWHQLMSVGTTEGTVECWDHRDKSRAGVLELRQGLADEIRGTSAVTALTFRDPLCFGVGTASGHVLLYDIRSSRPLLVKDSQNELPIRRIEFVRREEDDLVLSMDNRALKIWEERNGRAVTAIEPEAPINDFVRYPDSGLIFMAAESSKMLQYFAPLLGPAPKWCSFLEAITEELEESEKTAVYDDYKFVTEAQLDELGLKHLIGSPLLRAYMHGYFIDIRLYNKAKTKAQPFAFDNYKKRKITEAVENEREAGAVGVKLRKVEPRVKFNKELAEKLTSDASALQSKKKVVKEKALAASELLGDDRFTKLFESEDFQVDESSEVFQRMAAWMKKRDEIKRGRKDEPSDVEEDEESDHEPQTDYMAGASDDDASNDGRALQNGNDDEGDEEDAESSDEEDDDQQQEREQQKKAEMNRKKREAEARRLSQLREEQEAKKANRPTKFKLYSLEPGEGTDRFVKGMGAEDEKTINMAKRRATLKKEGALLQVEEAPFGGRSVTFTTTVKTNEPRRVDQKLEEHKKERKEVRRAATKLSRALDRKHGAWRKQK
ncbi:unnamed protein product, partial [Mesorhabditis spiculigera]